jgi:hypothetical protein
MAQDDVLAEGGDHGGRYFAGVSSGFLKVHILGANANSGGLEGFGDGLEGDEGGADNAVYLFCQAVEVVSNFPDEGDRFGRTFVHLPVSGNDRFSH